MNPFYYPPNSGQTPTGEPCNCGEQGHFLSCQNYQPFAEVDKEGKPLKIGYQVRAQSSFDSYSRIKLNFKPEWLKKPDIGVVSNLVAPSVFNTALSTEENVKNMTQDLLNVISRRGAKRNILLNAYLTDTYDPLDIEWLNGATVRSILDSFVEQYNNTVQPNPTTPATTPQIPQRDYTISEIWTYAYQYFDFLVMAENTNNYAGMFAFIPINTQNNINFKIAHTIIKFVKTVVYRMLLETTTTTNVPSPFLPFVSTGTVTLYTLGFLPALSVGFDGVMRVKYVSVVHESTGVNDRGGRPIFNMLLHYRTTSYDTNYGMSRIMKTVSLLPNEKTDMTIKTFKSSTSSRIKAENVLDSFTETSAQSLEHLVESETGHKTTNTENEKFDAKLGLKIDLTAVVGFPLGFEIGGNYNKTIVDKVTEDTSRTLNRALSKHTAESTRNRKVEINTTTNNIYTESSEELIVRRLENINHSRVLNFVYRQLYQEYLAITYLHNVTFEFGLDASLPPRTIKLTELNDFLTEICIDQTTVNEIMSSVLSQLWIVSDYQNNPQQFIGCREFDTSNALTQSAFIPSNCCKEWIRAMHHCFAHVLPNLSQEYEGIKVPGIILSAEPHQLPTDDLLCDAILGAGEALDCYNIRLQAEAVRKAELENDRTEQMIRIIGMLEKPELQAELYKKVFGECCDVPQVGCGCHTCKDVEIKSK